MNPNQTHFKIAFLYHIFLISILYMMGCSENPIRSSNYVVSGYIQSDSGYISNAYITVDNNPELTATSGEFGYFRITNIKAGDHNIDITKYYGNGSFVSRNYAIKLINNVHFSNLQLPQSVHLKGITNLRSDYVEIQWSPKNISNFTSYKLYRDVRQNVRKTESYLVYSSANYRDTLSIDRNVQAGQTYYYQLCYYTKDGSVSGSNIISTTTYYPNLIKNPSFEEIDSENTFPVDWGFEVLNHNSGIHTVYTTKNPHSGLYAFSISFDENSFGYGSDRYIFQAIPRINFEVGSLYRLTFWLWHPHFTSSREGISFELSYVKGPTAIMQTLVEPLQRETLDINPDYNWNKFSTEFVFPEDVVHNTVVLRIYVGQPLKSSALYIFDDFNLRKIE